jgi:CubicO group peptidase (beta-lactamase class C family)
MSRFLHVVLMLALFTAILSATERRAKRSELPRPSITTVETGGKGPGAPSVSPLNDYDLDRYIANYIRTKHIPGLAAAIVKSGKVLWYGSFGRAYIDPDVPVINPTLFILASISKTVTATALMQLYEDGLFDLYDPINDYLPFTVDHPDFPHEDITFHMLLTHSSGIKDNWNLMPYYHGDSPIPLGQYLYDYLDRNGANFDPNKNFTNWKPGTNFSYCNNAVALVGYLVEVISGIPFPQYCLENLFAPLEMNETAWMLADLDLDHVALPHYWNGIKYVALYHYGYSDYPSGQLRTSAPQLLRFLTAYMQKGLLGGVRILEEATVEMMLTPQIPQINPSQGLIWHKWNYGGRSFWGHGGGDMGTTTEMWFCPDEDSGVVILTNGESFFLDLVDTLFDYAEAH